MNLRCIRLLYGIAALYDAALGLLVRLNSIPDCHT